MEACVNRKQKQGRASRRNRFANCYDFFNCLQKNLLQVFSFIPILQNKKHKIFRFLLKFFLPRALRAFVKNTEMDPQCSCRWQKVQFMNIHPFTMHKRAECATKPAIRMQNRNNPPNITDTPLCDLPRHQTRFTNIQQSLNQRNSIGGDGRFRGVPRSCPELAQLF